MSIGNVLDFLLQKYPIIDGSISYIIKPLVKKWQIKHQLSFSDFNFNIFENKSILGCSAKFENKYNISAIEINKLIVKLSSKTFRNFLMEFLPLGKNNLKDTSKIEIAKGDNKKLCFIGNMVKDGNPNNLLSCYKNIFISRFNELNKSKVKIRIIVKTNRGVFSKKIKNKEQIQQIAQYIKNN